MNDEKTKKTLKLKTFDQIQNDVGYENRFPRKRQSQANKSSLPTTPNDDENIDDQVY